MCLICGFTFRQLDQHVVTKHKVSADDYRLRFGLASSRGLHCSQVREARAERGRRMWQEDQQFRDRFRPTKTTVADRRDASQSARRASAARAGVKASGAASGMAAHDAWLAGIDARVGAAATAAGFHDLHTMLATTIGLPAHDFARMLDLSVKQVWNLRRRHGYVSAGAGRPPGIEAGDVRVCLECGKLYKGLSQHVVMAHRLSMAGYRARHPLTGAGLEQAAGQPRPGPPGRPPVNPADLARVRHGIQPEDRETGRLLCLECGAWYRALGQHLTAGHHLPPADYRARHGLPPRFGLWAGDLKRRPHLAAGLPEKAAGRG